MNPDKLKIIHTTTTNNKKWQKKKKNPITKTY